MWLNRCRWAALALAVVIGACAPALTPVPPQPPPTVRAVAVVVPGVPHPVVYLDPIGTVTGDEQGYTLFPRVPEWLVDTWIAITADGYQPYRVDAVRLQPGNFQMVVGAGQLPPLVSSVVTLPRLVTNGQHFAQWQVGPFTAIGADGYALYQQYLDGVNIEPVVAQLGDLGFNVVRVFGMYDGRLGHFRPRAYGEAYWSARPAFYQILARHGLYGEWTALADGSVFSVNEQVDIAVGTYHAFDTITNALIEWVNEADQPMNRLDPVVLANLIRVSGVLTSHGSNGSQAAPVMPYLDYLTFHTNDAFEEQRKAGHNCWELDLTRPCFTNETSRSPSQPNWRGPAPLTFAFDTAAGAALLAAGSTYHSDAGKAGRLLAGPELDYAKAWVAGAKSVSLSCQNQPYRHRTDLEGSTYLRVYQRGTDNACIVRIRP